MEDLLGINISSGNVYIKHSSKEQCWVIGEDIHEDINYILVDPSTIQTGWGFYDGGYHFAWDEKPGVKGAQPTPDHKRAFSVWLYTKEHGPTLWRRFTWGEGQGFNKMCSLFWSDLKNNEGKVPCIMYKGSKYEKFNVGGSAIPQFEFIKWVDKPAEFTTVNMDDPIVDDSSNNQVDEPRSTLTDDDLPF